MECMDEFDPEVPLRVTYCRTLSQEEFEEQASAHTSAALAELSHTLVQKPQLHLRTLRRRRQEQAEEAGVFSFIKAKFYLLVQGEDNECNVVSQHELQREIEILREQMNRAFQHAQEAKDSGRRFSKRLADKKQTNHMAPPPSAPPPPPPAPPLPKIQVPLKEKTNAVVNAVAQTPELLKSYGLKNLNRKPAAMDTKTLRDASGNVPVHATSNSQHEMVSNAQGKRLKTDGVAIDAKTSCKVNKSECSTPNWQDELLSFGNKRLKTTAVVRSPGGTPADVVKRRHSIHQNVSPASTIKAALMTKFQNVSSPASSERSWYSLNGSFL